MSGERLEELQAEVQALRQAVESLRAMIEIRADGSGSWKIPERYSERRHSHAESVRPTPVRLG